MAIGVIDEDGWGEGVERYVWSGSGEELLVQLTESVRVYAVNGSLTEISVTPVELCQVLGIGSAAGAWWLLTKQGDVATYRKGLEDCDVPLERAAAQEISMPTVSPDGRTIACVEKNRVIGFWSTRDGARLFGIRIESEGGDQELFGQAGIESMNWSPDARYLAIKPSFPMSELVVVNIEKRKCLA